MTDSTISSILNTLSKSKFRSKFKLARKDRDYIANKGLETIKDHAYQFINSRVAPDFPKNDGKQTPMRGHPVFIAACHRHQLPGMYFKVAWNREGLNAMIKIRLIQDQKDSHPKIIG
jgi:hypothetical protein